MSSRRLSGRAMWGDKTLKQAERLYEQSSHLIGHKSMEVVEIKNYISILYAKVFEKPNEWPVDISWQQVNQYLGAEFMTKNKLKYRRRAQEFSEIYSNAENDLGLYHPMVPAVLMLMGINLAAVKSSTSSLALAAMIDGNASRADSIYSKFHWGICSLYKTPQDLGISNAH